MENNEFWDFYWEMHLQAMENLGKREAILTASRLIRRLAQDPQQPVRLLELGCGEAQIIGTLVEAHSGVRSIRQSVGVDYLHSSILTCRKDYPGMTFIEGDFTDPALLENLGSFEIVLLVNALHEVFSSTYSEELGQVDVEDAKPRVEQAFAGAVQRLAPGGYLLLFDGLEPPGDIEARLRVRFLEPGARELFEVFARQYRPFQIAYREVGPWSVELSRHDFARYITKSIFLGKGLWQSERLESYQYLNEAEFRAMFDRSGLLIQELRTMTVNEDKWRKVVEIETPGEDFPQEHILIVAHKLA